MIPRLTYFKRYRMELDLNRPLPEARLPDGFDWLPYDDRLLDAHAEAKFLSFRHELDSQVFPSLGHPAGCKELMRAIRCRPGFCPQATWLIAGPDGGVGTVQGLRDESGFGAIQNLGVVPNYRGLGLGAALLAKALLGFRAVGAPRVYLEVTAKNDPAVRMYRSFGFRSYRTIYKALPATEPAPVGMGI
jgi:ribosomal protein S18 acetylase RimI-like enzyme